MGTHRPLCHIIISSTSCLYSQLQLWLQNPLICRCRYFRNNWLAWCPYAKAPILWAPWTLQLVTKWCYAHQFHSVALFLRFERDHPCTIPLWKLSYLQCQRLHVIERDEGDVGTLSYLPHSSKPPELKVWHFGDFKLSI